MKTRFYGGDGTIHGSTELDVETRDGKVVAVWFRCAALPFKQVEVDAERAKEMRRMYADGAMPRVRGLQLEDQPALDITSVIKAGVAIRDSAERVYAFCPECDWTYGGVEVESWRAGLRCMNSAAPDCGGMLNFVAVSSSVEIEHISLDSLPDFEVAHV